ncbi:MAG TPA: tetratricopeptide repeat protein, partial [Pseudonocardiaceae bacterium]|nr:tetratricopeptide repeat protein [Pseudonocardiaceae bacterium]
ARPVTSRSVTGTARPGSLIRLPEVLVSDHLAPVLDNPQVPEHKRFCPNSACRHETGRARNGRPGLVEGFCPQCRTRFSFQPPLLPGLLVGGQFEVEGAIAHGGLGWVYRARDCLVPRRVVLKGLIDPDDPDKRQAAVTELAALAKASHPNIVTVHTVVRHPHPLTGRDVDYIVMEFLSGKSLKQLYQERPDSDPYLPVDQVCGYGLEVLAALSHLHEKRGLLYCDLSGDNVIHSTDGVKLIDLGAVRRIDDSDSPVWGKAGFQDPKIATHGPSVATDLYAVARMMAVLSFPFPGFSADKPIPDPDEVELLARHPSFHGLLRRATNPDPQRRFASAADMTEQLEGVLREVRAQQEGRPFPAASTRFSPELRVVGADPTTFPTGEPDIAAAALALPGPQVDPADPHAGLLAAISADSRETERVLTALADPSLETRLRVARARIELGQPEAGSDLDALAQEKPGDWRVDWLRGLRSLVNGDVEPARREFTAVLDALPGEAAPKLALALCAARDGASETAARGYATVWQTDQSYVSAAFGLARARFALGDLAGTAAALESVPDSSRYAVTARLCAILARARECAAGKPPAADLFTAAERLNDLDLDEQRRALAIAEVLETVLSWESAGRSWPHGTPIPDVLLGHQLNEHGVRDGLEATYRKLARLARTAAERFTFVDKANDRRKRSWR